MWTNQALQVQASIRQPHRELRPRQQGVVLIFALIVLAVLALASVAMIRSVDVGNLAAGNLSFKQNAFSATDIGVEAAVAKFRAGGTLGPAVSITADVAAQTYFATIQATNANGIPTALLDTVTFDAAFASNCFWANATWQTTLKACTTAAGADDLAQVRYLIDRQCTAAGPANDTTCNYIGETGASAGSTSTTHTGVSNSPLYRVSVRVDGSKNTTSFSQVVFRP